MIAREQRRRAKKHRSSAWAYQEPRLLCCGYESYARDGNAVTPPEEPCGRLPWLKPRCHFLACRLSPGHSPPLAGAIGEPHVPEQMEEHHYVKVFAKPHQESKASTITIRGQVWGICQR